jgi:hypothetical protein
MSIVFSRIVLVCLVCAICGCQKNSPGSRPAQGTASAVASDDVLSNADDLVRTLKRDNDPNAAGNRVELCDPAALAREISTGQIAPAKITVECNAYLSLGNREWSLVLKGEEGAAVFLRHVDGVTSPGTRKVVMSKEQLGTLLGLLSEIPALEPGDYEKPSLTVSVQSQTSQP